MQLDLLLKGDVPGHDFHGNQWTGGLATAVEANREQGGKLNAEWDEIFGGQAGGPFWDVEGEKNPKYWTVRDKDGKLVAGATTVTKGISIDLLAIGSHAPAQGKAILDAIKTKAVFIQAMASSAKSKSWFLSQGFVAKEKKGNYNVLWNRAFQKTSLSLLTKAKSRPQQTSGTWEYVDAHEGKLANRLRNVLKRAAKDVVGGIGKRLKLEKGGEGSGNFGHAGRPGEVGGSGESITLFHGTTSAVIDSIKESGLRAGLGRGSSAAAGFRESTTRRESVFASTTKAAAERYANYAMQVHRDASPVILTIHVPSDEFKKFRVDKLAENAVYYHGRIPPEWIVGYEEIKKAEQDVVPVYAVVVVLPKKITKTALTPLTKTKPPQSKEVQDILDQLDLDGISSIMVDELTDEMKDAFKAAGVRAYQQVGFKDTPEIVDHMDQAALDYAGMRGAELVGKRVLADGTVVDNPNAAWSITNTMRDDLRDLVSDAIVEGWSTGDLQDAIQDSFSFSDARAEMIARTELAYAHVAGNMEGWRESGVVEKKRWIAADADPCPECEALDGEEVGLDEDFSSGDDGPPAHPACRCSLVPVTASVEDIIGAYTGLAPEDYEEEKVDLGLLRKGGEGSGNFGHAGRPGEVGGSAAEGTYTDENGFTRSGGLSDRERSAEQVMYDRIKNSPASMIAEYQSRFGHTIDPDNVKQLSPEFRADKSLAAAVHEPSSLLSKMIYEKELADNKAGGNKLPVIFTAGGGGSGKTEAMGVAKSALGVKGDAIVFDSTLSSSRSAIGKVDQALASGAKVDILYTNRPVDDAFRFAAGRSRVVHVDVLAKTHVGASDTIRSLAEHYRGNSRVSISVINNFGSVADMAVGAIADVPRYNYNGVEQSLRQTAKTLLETGAISNERYKALVRGGSGKAAKSFGGIQSQTRGADLGSTGGRTGSRGNEEERQVLRKTSVSHLLRGKLYGSLALSSRLNKIHHPHKRRYGDKWQVVDDDGKVYGTHDTEKQANRQLAALYANKVDLSLLMKGDVPGHEFHGNQWTGGTGSTTDQEIRAGVSSVAKQLGYPEEKITYSTEQQDFKVGGVDYVASGQANRDTGEITLFPNTILNRAEAEGVVAHEIGHCQFEAVKSSIGTAAFFDSMEKDWFQLLKDDGVSEYSRDWWDALSKGDANLMQCLHETFAEITRLDYEGKRDGKTLTEQGVKQSWRKLYMRFQKEYQKAKK